jgi:hypothetical protein
MATKKTEATVVYARLDYQDCTCGNSARFVGKVDGKKFFQCEDCLPDEIINNLPKANYNG